MPFSLSPDNNTDQYCVIGNPIAHSKSPQIHALFSKQTAQSLNYQRLFSELDAFCDTVEGFRLSGGRGLNVTTPFKEQAWRYVNDCTDRANRVKAVNVISFDEDERGFGDSTDGVGLVRDLANNHIDIRNKRLLLLGAGGAVRSVLGHLMDERPRAMTIVNRTRERAQAVAAAFPQASAHVCGFDELPANQFDLIINGTSAGLRAEPLPLPDGILSTDGCCYDMSYGEGARLFLDWARKNNALMCCDGLGMLVEQAAESFYLWRGIMPETRPVIAQLREKQGNAD